MYSKILIDIKKESLKKITTIKKKILYIFMIIFGTDNPDIEIISNGITIQINVNKYLRTLADELIPCLKYLLIEDIFSITIDSVDLSNLLTCDYKYKLKYTIDKTKISNINKDILKWEVGEIEKTIYYCVDVIDMGEFCEIIILSNEKIKTTVNDLNFFFLFK